MGSKGSKRHDKDEKHETITTSTTKQQMTSLPNTIPTSATQAGIIAGSSTVPGMVNSIPGTISVPSGTITDNSGIPGKIEQVNPLPYTTITGENLGSNYNVNR